MSPLDLGGDPLELPPGDGGDGSPEERDPEGGWKALWRLVNDHKSRQALERNAAKKARQGGVRGLHPPIFFAFFLFFAHCFVATRRASGSHLFRGETNTAMLSPPFSERVFCFSTREVEACLSTTGRPTSVLQQPLPFTVRRSARASRRTIICVPPLVS